MSDKKWTGEEGTKNLLKQDPKAKFLDSRGQLRTASLFYETNLTDYEPLYTLRAYDVDGLPSLKQLYMDMLDTTEYLFAEKYLYDFNHWKKIKNNQQVWKWISTWEDELELRIRALSLQNLVELSEDKGNLGLQASKFISQKGWEKNTKGRPTKAQIEKEAKKNAILESTFKEDIKRLKLDK